MKKKNSIAAQQSGKRKKELERMRQINNDSKTKGLEPEASVDAGEISLELSPGIETDKKLTGSDTMSGKFHRKRTTEDWLPAKEQFKKAGYKTRGRELIEKRREDARNKKLVHSRGISSDNHPKVPVTLDGNPTLISDLPKIGDKEDHLKSENPNSKKPLKVKVSSSDDPDEITDLKRPIKKKPKSELEKFSRSRIISDLLDPKRQKMGKGYYRNWDL